MATETHSSFISYCRKDSEFALKLAEDLKAAGADVWLDQLDIVPGEPWDHAVQHALTSFPRMIVILSPASVGSANVLDEVSFGLHRRKTIIPVLYQECDIPFRLHRIQHIDFTHNYEFGLKVLLKTLTVLTPEERKLREEEQQWRKSEADRELREQEERKAAEEARILVAREQDRNNEEAARILREEEEQQREAALQMQELAQLQRQAERELAIADEAERQRIEQEARLLMEARAQELREEQRRIDQAERDRQAEESKKLAAEAARQAEADRIRIEQEARRRAEEQAERLREEQAQRNELEREKREAAALAASAEAERNRRAEQDRRQKQLADQAAKQEPQTELDTLVDSSSAPWFRRPITYIAVALVIIAGIFFLISGHKNGSTAPATAGDLTPPGGDWASVGYLDPILGRCNNLQPCLDQKAKADKLIAVKDWKKVLYSEPLLSQCLDDQPCIERQSHAKQLMAVHDWSGVTDPGLLNDCMSLAHASPRRREVRRQALPLTRAHSVQASIARHSWKRIPARAIPAISRAQGNAESNLASLRIVPVYMNDRASVVLLHPATESMRQV